MINSTFVSAQSGLNLRVGKFLFGVAIVHNKNESLRERVMYLLFCFRKGEGGVA